MAFSSLLHKLEVVVFTSRLAGSCVSVVLLLVVVPPGFAQKSTGKDPKDPVLSDKPLSAWVEQLNSADTTPRRDAATVLLKSGDRIKPATPKLLQILKDGNDPDSRQLAAFIIGSLKLEPKMTAGPLTDALKDASPEVRRAAATALCKFGPDAVPVIPEMLKVMKDADEPDSRQLAAFLVGQYKVTDDAVQKAIMETLLGALKDEHTAVRRAAATSVFHYPRQTKIAVKPLLDDLRDPDEDIRQLAAYVLEGLHPEGDKDVVAALEAALKDSSDLVRKAAGSALKVIDPKAAEKAGVK